MSLFMEGGTRKIDYEEVCSFCDTLDCGLFTYMNVMSCYSRLVGRDWPLPGDDVSRGPRIPTASEVAHEKRGTGH